MNINDFKGDFDKGIEFFKHDIVGLRTGRASTAMVEDISIEAYGIYQSLKSLASISVSDAKTLVIEPWDKSVFGALEKGIRDSGLGINPVNDGKVLRLSMPELTSERRSELTKILHQKTEQARVAMRKVREEARELIGEEEKSKSISEDDKFRLQDEFEKMVKEYGEKIGRVAAEKEKEINTI